VSWLERIIIVQTKLPEDVLEELKRKTGESTTKEALAKAIDHYLYCFNVEKDQKTPRKVRRRGGRFPVYLNQLFEKYKLIAETTSNDIE
jgi:hypothetical protein